MEFKRNTSNYQAQVWPHTEIAENLLDDIYMTFSDEWYSSFDCN